MRSVKTPIATMAALGVAGIVTQAHATIITVPFTTSWSSGTDTPIDINGVQEFAYNSKQVVPGYYEATFGTVGSGEIATTFNAGTPSFDSSLTYQNAAPASVSKDGALQGTGYVNLLFETGGQTDYGYASFNSAGDLTSITYETTAVPEPSTWAMLIAGAGLIGFAARRRAKLASIAA